MRSFFATLRRLVLPAGATTGARIVLDGVLGKILGYASNGTLEYTLDNTGLTVGANASSGKRIVIDGTTAEIHGYTAAGLNVYTLTDAGLTVTGADGSIGRVTPNGSNGARLEVTPAPISGQTLSAGTVDTQGSAGANAYASMFITSPAVGSKAAAIILMTSEAADSSFADKVNVLSTEFVLSSTKRHFGGGSPIAKPAVTGSRADPEQALKNLLIALANQGLITNSTTA